MKNVIWILIIVGLVGAKTDSTLSIKINRIEEQLSGNTKQLEQLQNEINEYKNESSLHFKDKILELNKEELSFRITIVTILLSGIGILIMFLGIAVPLFGLKKLNKLGQDAKENIKTLMDDSEKNIQSMREKIENYEKQADKSAQNIKKIEEELVKKSDNEKDKKELSNTLEKVKNNFEDPSDYMKELYEAAKLFAKDNPDALKAYENILANHSNKIEPERKSDICFRIAYLYERQAESKQGEERKKLLTKAQNMYKQALKSNPKDIDDIYNNLVGVLLTLADQQDEENEKLDLLKEAEDTCSLIKNKENKNHNLFHIYIQKRKLTKNNDDTTKLFSYMEEALQNEKLFFKDIDSDPALADLKENNQYKKLERQYKLSGIYD
jgi:Sec-independent protein translocase protein TatA